jgi:hypothetical protein
MKNLFIGYLLSVELMKPGFNEPCFAYYGEINGGEIELFYKKRFDTEHVGVLAPTIQQVEKWLLEKHDILLIPNFDDNLWTCDIFEFAVPDLVHIETVGLEEKESYNESLLAKNEIVIKAIEESLKKIKKLWN